MERKSNPIKRIFDLYTSDLSFDEIERLVKRESAEVYDFFKGEIPPPDKNTNKFIRSLIFTRSIFNAFLLKLSAGRRIFYLVSILFFIVGYLQFSGFYLILSFLILNALLAFELADKLITKDELQLAKKIQLALMDEAPARIHNFEVAAYYKPAREVGGDYFDIIEMEDGNTLLTVGDISGKGLPAALYMIRVQAIINLLAQSCNDVTQILIKLKNYFSKNLRPEYFLTLISALVSKNSDLKICSAGHLPVLWYQKEEENFELINPQGIGIGLNDGGVFEKTLDEKTITTHEGDILIFYTDGITESMDNFKRQFGMNAIKKIIGENANESAEIIKNKIISSIQVFLNGAVCNDDLTFVVLKNNHDYSTI